MIAARAVTRVGNHQPHFCDISQVQVNPVCFLPMFHHAAVERLFVVEENLEYDRASVVASVIDSDQRCESLVLPVELENHLTRRVGAQTLFKTMSGDAQRVAADARVIECVTPALRDGDRHVGF